MPEKKEFIRYIGKKDSLDSIKSFRDFIRFVTEETEGVNSAVMWHKDHLPAKKLRLTIEVIDD